jgi:phosphoglycolate phosphatase
MAKYESVIFDLDGTLVDSAPGIEHALLESVQLILPDSVIDLPDIRPHIGPPLPELVRRLFPHVTPQVAEQIETRFGLVYDHTGWQLTRVYESAIKTLSWLADHQVGCFLVTNKRQKPTRQILIKFGLLQFFIEVVSADTNGPTLESKEEMVSHLVEKHLLNPGRTLMVGDTHSDATAARMCGMHFALAVYGYGSGYTDREWQEAHILHSISDLVQIVSAPT